MEGGWLTFAIHRVPVHHLGVRAQQVHLPEGVLQVHLTELRGRSGSGWEEVSVIFSRSGRAGPVGSCGASAGCMAMFSPSSAA